MGSLKEESHANNGTKHCMFMIQITIPKIMTCILTKHMMYGYCAKTTSPKPLQCVKYMKLV